MDGAGFGQGFFSHSVTTVRHKTLSLKWFHPSSFHETMLDIIQPLLCFRASAVITSLVSQERMFIVLMQKEKAPQSFPPCSPVNQTFVKESDFILTRCPPTHTQKHTHLISQTQAHGNHLSAEHCLVLTTKACFVCYRVRAPKETLHS